MNVTLLTSHDALSDMVHFAVTAALTCRDNTDKDVDHKELLLRIIKMGHESILEHINLTYSIKGISRAVLQELARHRHISLSVESTRHTLRKKLDDIEALRDYLSEFHNSDVVLYHCATSTLKHFAELAHVMPDMPNDELKYYLPEFWPTNLILTSNIRELRHILKLRTHPSALMEFRKLGVELFTRVPDDFKYLLEDCVYIGG